MSNVLGWIFHRVTGAAVVAIGIAGSPLGVDLFGAKAAAILTALGYVLNQTGAHLATKNGV